MLRHRAERNSLENSLFEVQRLTTQLQTQQEQLEGKAEAAQLARRALQGAAVDGLSALTPKSPLGGTQSL